MNAELADSTILVTGASGGIGGSVAHLLLAEGARIGVHFHRNDLAAAEIVQSAPKGRAIACGADLQDEDQVERLFNTLIKAWGRLDAIVVNAGIWIEKPAPIHEMSLEQWHRTLETDLTGAFLCCRAFFRHLVDLPREHASVVFVGSTAGMYGEADHVDYAAAKAGMIHGLTRTLKNEIVRLAPLGRVNTVCPGWTRTPMAEQGLTEDSTRRVFATASLRKVAEPNDVAHAVVFLLSQRLSGHLSGSITEIAGGMEGRLLHAP